LSDSSFSAHWRDREGEEFANLLVKRLEASGLFDATAIQQARTLIHKPGWAGALTILSFPPLARRIRKYIDLEEGWLDIDRLLSGSIGLSSGEDVLVRAAISLYNDGATVTLGEAMTTLGKPWTDALIAGLLAYRHRVSYQAMN
jgi:hypothetical protein